MKKQLFTLVALLCASVSTLWAGNWSTPVLRTVSEFSVSTTEPGDTAMFYLYHVGRQQMLTQGAMYGKQATLDSTALQPLPFVITKVENGYQLYSPKAASDKYLFRRSAIMVYTDYNAGNGYNGDPITLDWDIVSQGNGYFRLMTPAADAQWGENGTGVNTDIGENTFCLGWDPEGQDGNNTETNQAVIMLDPQREDVELDWTFVSEAGYAQYQALLKLFDALNEAEEAGVATAAAEQVYNNVASTAEQILATVESLHEAMANKLFAEASEDNPVDITALKVVNADFSEGSMNGWNSENNILVYSGDTFPNSSANADNGGETFSKAIAAWKAASAGGLADDQVSQVVKGLPAGKYSLTASLVAQHGADLPKGTFLFMSGVTESTTECTFDADWFQEQVNNNMNNQIIQHPLVEIVHAGGDLTIGLRMRSTNCNWVYADNFKLQYYGPTNDNPYLIALRNTVEKAYEYTDENTYYYGVETASELSTAINNATALMAGAATNDELQASRSTLETLMTKVQNEVKAYESLKTFMEEVAADRDRYAQNPALVNFSAELQSFYSDLDEHYNSRDVNAEQIAQIINAEAYQARVNAAIAAAMNQATPDNPVEITSLYVVNPDFETGNLDGWTNDGFSYSGDAVPNYDPTKDGGIDYNDGYKFSHYAHAWVASSTSLSDKTLYQTLENMPAGLYILGADVVAQHGQDIITGVQLYLNSNGVEQFTECNVDAYVMNQYIMRDKTVSIYHLGGDLTIGFRTRSTNANWAIADNFTLNFGGQSASAMYATMQELLSQATTINNEMPILVDELDEMMTNAVKKAGEVSETDEEGISQAITMLGEAIVYAQESVQLYEELGDVYNVYEYRVGYDEVTSEEPSYMSLMSTVATAIDEGGFTSNAQIQQYIDKLHNGWAPFVQYPVLQGSSEKNPGNITPVLYMHDFTDPVLNENSAAGWTVAYDGGHGKTSVQNNNTQSDAYELYNNNSFRISQTVKGLAAGYYRLRVQGFYRPGANKTFVPKYEADPTFGNYVYLFAEVGDQATSSLVKNVLQRDDEEGDIESGASVGVDGEVAITYGENTEFYIPNTMDAFAGYADMGIYWNKHDFYLDKDQELTVGLFKDSHETDDWCIIDNFELYYLGTEPPTGIESLNASDASRAKATAIYNLAGQRVAKAVKGLYIVGGKKVLVR